MQKQHVDSNLPRVQHQSKHRANPASSIALHPSWQKAAAPVQRRMALMQPLIMTQQIESELWQSN